MSPCFTIALEKRVEVARRRWPPPQRCCVSVLRALIGDCIFRSVRNNPQGNEKKDEKYWNRLRTRKNHVVRGFGPRAEMLRWQEKNPEEFEDTYHQRSIVESVFSSFKCRFTAVVRAKKLSTQRLQLLLRCVCYNLLS